jgi:hypothetical protein
MTPYLDVARDVVEHLVDAITAHGLVEVDRPTVVRSRAWLRQLLPPGDQGLLDAAARDPAAGPVREALRDAIHAMLRDNPGLLSELRGLLGAVS